MSANRIFQTLGRSIEALCPFRAMQHIYMIWLDHGTIVAVRCSIAPIDYSGRWGLALLIFVPLAAIGNIAIAGARSRFISCHLLCWSYPDLPCRKTFFPASPVPPDAF